MVVLKRRLLVLGAVSLVTAMAVAGGVVALDRFGIELVQPTPQRYADRAVQRMAAGAESSPGRVMAFEYADRSDEVSIDGDDALLRGVPRASAPSSMPKSDLPVAVDADRNGVQYGDPLVPDARTTSDRAPTAAEQWSMTPGGPPSVRHAPRTGGHRPSEGRSGA